jgi:hypothetical protein
MRVTGVIKDDDKNLLFSVFLGVLCVSVVIFFLSALCERCENALLHERHSLHRPRLFLP